MPGLEIGRVGGGGVGEMVGQYVEKIDQEEEVYEGEVAERFGVVGAKGVLGHDVKLYMQEKLYP